MKRLFIAINLPKSIKKEIKIIVNDLRTAEELKAVKNIKWTPLENWHLTMSFLGNQPDRAIDLIVKSIQETKETIGYFNSHIFKNMRIKIEFEKFIFAPIFAKASADKPPRPRMIWLTTTKKTSRILEQLKNNLEKNLIKNGVRFKQENRRYNGHITVARFRLPLINADFEQINLNIIRVNQHIKLRKSALSFQVRSLDLMESRPNRIGSEYKIIISCEIG